MYICAIATALFVGSPQEAVLLVRTLPAKATETYKVDYYSEATQGTEGGYSTTMRWMQEFAFDQPDLASKRVPVTINIKDRHFDTTMGNYDGPIPPASQTIVGWSLSADNRLQKDSPIDPAKKRRGFFPGLPVDYVSFPATAVKPGDSWEIPTLLTDKFDNNAKPLKVTFVGEKEVEGKKYWNLKIDDSRTYKYNLPEDEVGTNSGTVKTLLDCLIDKETGRQEITDIKVDGQNTWKSTEMTADSEFKLKLRIVLVKDPKGSGA